MSVLLPHVAARMFDTPLMIAPEKAAAMLVGMGARVIDGGVVLEGVVPTEHVAFQSGRPSMGVIGDRLGRRVTASGGLPYDLVENVAVIAVEGTLVHKGAYLGQSSGETSYQGLQAQIAHAGRNPMVRGVAFEVDSFGGESAGAFQTAEMIAKLSAAKPTMAILTDFGLSAGYLVTAPCRQVVMPKHGAAGSIGVMAMHRDVSKSLEQKGETITLIYSGARKVDGHPAKPLADEAKARMQARVDAQRDAFAAAVGQYRGRRLTKERALATEAQIYGGDEAVALGLADATGHGHEAFEAFVRAVNKA